MKLKATLVVSAVALLAACGGGGGSVSNIPPSTSPNVSTLKTYNNGNGVLSTERVNLGAAGGTANILIAAPDITAAREVALGSINLQEIPGTAAGNGRFYVVSRTGTASNGTSLRVDTAGENLPSGTEYASISILTINNRLGVASTGSPANGIPSGTYSYSGTASVIDTVTGAAGDGTFTLTANFNNNTGTLAATVPANTPIGANNPAFFFSSNNLQINQSNGSFSSSNALIGQTGVTSNAASVNGYFAGTNATGVHGLVYTNDPTSPTYAGVFYGSR